ncbi:GAF domain-containing protein [Acidaminobacter sp. JC074]|uniref:GAF domain-containing protein n=1 Tax=Acidaminobacter sp. JC074 TaxID=2530199 RepID=UPI001F0F95FB|nr:GAF domain-containing protein [Acidaminobacter sp. JC074]MCH4888295.1 GAF domain-containing protein [Acidaminobacter sp. JC074]
MKQIDKIDFETKKQLYKYMNIKLTGLIGSEDDWLANLSNASALLWLLLDDINWAGFYLYRKDKLILGPFQGKPACVNIEISKGVCGTAAETRTTQLIKNVHDFPGHIACDSASNSEIVVPIIKDDQLIGVLDIDAPILNRFDQDDQAGLEKFVETLNKYMKWEDIL